ncbi:MAG: dipeptide epimerase [Bacteroidetes bacterium]|nr:MAG: dipeptide epimerase [Bacteroidota bacterium]
MKVQYKTFELPFTHPFTISKGTKTHQPTFIVELQQFGHCGLGEAPAIAYYNIPLEKMAADLKAKQAFIEKFAYTEPERFWHYVHHLFPNNNFLVCALDMASWDIFGKMKRKPLYQFWSENATNLPLTDFTIGIDSIEKMVEKMQEKPWPIYKIKLGTPNDIAIVEALRKHTDAVFRIDANAAWTAAEALEKIPLLKALGVEFIEQPLAKDDWEGMKKLYAESSLPLMADEACVYEADVNKCHQHFHGINIKLTKCGGITPALRMIKAARKLGLKVMVGSMNECSIGSAAIMHLLPLIDYVDMDGPLLLAQDLATGIGFDQGRVLLPEAPGLGIASSVFA